MSETAELTPGQRTQSQMRDALTAAIKTRNAVTVAALRSALAALANAEAVSPGGDQPVSTSDSEHVAGARVGLGAAEVPRRQLTQAQVADVLEREAAERHTAADELGQRGQPAAAARLRAEADALAPFLQVE